MAQRDLVVRFIGDDRDLQRAFTTSERRATQFQGRMGKLNQSLRGGLTGGFGAGSSLLFGSGAFIGSAAITKGISESIQAASDLNEQLSRSNQVFRENAKSVQDWSATLASSFGIAQSQGLEFAGTFGLLFKNIGVSTDQAETFSRQLVELAADLASFNNTTVDDALNALRSGLTGEIEPLRRYGVFLNEARSNQIALAESGKKSTTALTTQDKVLARLNIIMADTVRAQGDFARTSDGLANKQRIAAAEAQNLAANLGKALAPAMDITLTSAIALTGGLNDLITGLGDLREEIKHSQQFEGFNKAVEDATGGIEGFFKSVRDGIPGMEHFLALRDRISGKGAGTPDTIPGTIRPGPQGGNRFEARAAAAQGAALATITAAQNAAAAEKAAGEAFNAFVKGLGLKIDKASLTEDLADDLAALRELERAILRRIETEGKTFKLVKLLTDTRIRINQIVQQQAEDAKQAGIDAFEATQDALDLNLEMAQATKSLADDQAALRAIEQSILKRIAAEGETTDLLRRLFEVRQQQQEVARQLADQQRERRKSLQFERLGLTEEGDRPTPGVGALSRRLKSLREQVKGTALDTEKTRRELDRIAAVLSGKFGAVGKDVRAAILQMFEDIASALDEGQSGKGRKGPLTKTSGLNTKKILDGLGLTPEQENELRGRLSSINTAGRQLQAATRQAGTTTTGTGNQNVRGGRGGVVVENFVTVEIDGQKITATVTKEQQRTSRRNPQQKRGPNRHR